MVKKTVIKIIADQINMKPSELGSNQSLFYDLSMDGDEFMTVIAILEDEFETEFDEDALDEIETVSDLVRFIEDNM